MASVARELPCIFGKAEEDASWVALGRVNALKEIETDDVLPVASVA